MKIDHSRSKVYDIQFGFWEDAKLIDAAYTHAESRITEEAYKMGITADCEDAANKVLKPILNALGFNKVSIRFKTKNAQKNSSDNNALKMLE